jgi:hypothetical protein
MGLALLWLVSCFAVADADVQVEADASLIRVSAQIATRVDRETAWRVLSDYDRWAEFVPDMLLSRVVSKPGEPLQVEQRGRIPWLPVFPLAVVADVDETPYRGLRFQRVAGNIKALQGEWRIEGDFPVHLIYRSTVELGFPMLPLITIEILRQNTKARLEAMAAEMARTAGARRE